MQTLTVKSKFKYLEGRPSKETFSNLNLSTISTQGDFIASNGVWVAFPWNVGGGGKVMIRRSDQFGKIQNSDPSIIGHSGKITDTAFSPYNDFIFSTASQDGCIKLWELPIEGNLATDIKKELSTLNGHTSKIQLLTWHVNAENILASGSNTGELLIWDVLKEDPIFEIQLARQSTNSLKWNLDGSLLAVTQRDKKTKIVDPRASKIVNEWECHAGSQAQKIQFIDQNTLISIGTSKVNEQQFGGWDIRNTSEPVFFKVGGTGKRLTRPYVIQDNNILLTVGKGQSTIHFYEILKEEPYLDKLMGWRGSVEQIGFQLLPQRMCDEKQCVIAKAARLSDKSAHFLSFAVPRKATAFQKDLFPPCPSYLPSLSAQKWYQQIALIFVIYVIDLIFRASGQTVETVRMMWQKPGFERICYPNKNSAPKKSVESGSGVNQQVKEKLAELTGQINQKNDQIVILKQLLQQALEKQAEQEQTIKIMTQQMENLNLQLQQQKQQQQSYQNSQVEQEKQHYVDANNSTPPQPQNSVFEDQQQQVQYNDQVNQPGSVYQSIMQDQPIPQDDQQQQQQQQQQYQYQQQQQYGRYEQDFINQYGQNQANQEQNYNQNEYNYGGSDFADAQ